MVRASVHTCLSLTLFTALCQTWSDSPPPPCFSYVEILISNKNSHYQSKCIILQIALLNFMPYLMLFFPYVILDLLVMACFHMSCHQQVKLAELQRLENNRLENLQSFLHTHGLVLPIQCCLLFFFFSHRESTELLVLGGNSNKILW